MFTLAWELRRVFVCSMFCIRGSRFIRVFVVVLCVLFHVFFAGELTKFVHVASQRFNYVIVDAARGGPAGKIYPLCRHDNSFIFLTRSHLSRLPFYYAASSVW